MTRRALQPLLALAAWAGPLCAQPAAGGAATVRPATFAVGRTPVAVEEGSFVVPANRRSGASATLTLAYVRFPSTAATPASPIVFLAGGPGDAATRALAGMPLALLDSLRTIADVIAFDQRGTGRSEPRDVRCPPGAPQPLDRPTDPASMLAELRERVTSCVAGAAGRGVDVAGLTTAESADDLEALRQALGAPRLDLLAGSYGTHLALAAAARHPALVSRMVLAGVEGPDDTIKLPSRVDEVLATIARARRPTLVDDVRTLRDRLAAQPTRHELALGQTIVLGAWDVQRWVAESLDTVQEIDAMLAAIPALLDGRHDALARWAVRARAPRPLNLMNLAMDCASYASPARLARVERERASALLGDAMSFPLPALCAAPGLPRLGDDFRRPARSDAPALLVSGTFDGRTPPPNAEEAARVLPNARTLVVEGASHGLFREASVNAAMLEFFRSAKSRN